ncbi:unnamed protein product [Umbelopsis vinacea]|jgi:hypothetical protein
MNRILSAFDGLKSAVTGLDQRAINQFSISTNWDTYVESPGDRERLHSLVSLPPADDQFEKVRKYIAEYYRTAAGMLYESYYLFRRWINNKDGYRKTSMS